MEHISNPEIRAFLERHLAPGRLLEIDDHLADCQACQATLEREARAGRAVAGLQADYAATQAHLEYEQVLCLAEGREVPVEIEHHAAHCSLCAYQVDELRNFITESNQAPRSVSTEKPAARRARVLSWRPRLAWSALAAATLIGAGLYWQTSLRNTQRVTTLASLHDGNYELSLDKSGHLQGAKGLQPDQQEEIQSVLNSGRLAVGQDSHFSSSQQETMLGGKPAELLFRVLSPVNQVVIDDRPTFTWQPLSNTTAYRVRVYSAGYHKIAESPFLHDTTWRADASLPRGNTYTWTVTAQRPEGEVRAPAPPQPEATFRVADVGTASTLDQASSNRATDHLLLAVLYARAGAVDQARAQLELLREQNPGNRLIDQMKASLDQSVPSPISTKGAQ